MSNIFNKRRFSVSRRFISIDRRGGEVMAVLNASVSGVALDAVHGAVLHALNKAYMVGQAVALPIVKGYIFYYSNIKLLEFLGAGHSEPAGRICWRKNLSACAC